MKNRTELSIYALLVTVVLVTLLRVFPVFCFYCGETVDMVSLVTIVFGEPQCHVECYWRDHPIPPEPKMKIH